MPKTHIKKIILHSIECQRLSEENDDELYINVMSFDIHGNILKEIRFPNNEIWEFHKNERKVLNQLIYEHDEHNIDIVSIVFMEEDAHGFSRLILEKIRTITHHSLPDLVDDYLGVIYIKMVKNSLVEWTGGQNCYELEDAPSEPYKSFVLTIPNKFQYSLTFIVENSEDDI